MQAISLIDLDGSLFQPKGDCPADVPLTGAAQNTKGEWQSFCTPQQVSFLDMLTRNGIVVPVTARETCSFRRVKLEFTSHAILSFGAVILTPEGEIEPRWHARMMESSSSGADAVVQVKEHLASVAAAEGIDARIYEIVDAGMTLYINVKHNSRNTKELKKLGDMVAHSIPKGWKIHVNWNNLAVLPPYIGKENAVAFYLENLAPAHSFVLGLGDSFTDIGFMGLCDYAITPTQGQIYEFLSNRFAATRRS